MTIGLRVNLHRLNLEIVKFQLSNQAERAYSPPLLPESRRNERLCQLRDVSEDILNISKDIVSFKPNSSLVYIKFCTISNHQVVILAHSKLKRSRGSGNNPQLATNSGGCASLSISNQKRNLGGFNRSIFTSVIASAGRH